MARKKRKLNQDADVAEETDNNLKVTNQRTRQKGLNSTTNTTEIKPKTRNKKAVSEPVIKKTKVATKQIKQTNDTSFKDNEQSSQESMDSGIASGLSIGNESYSSNVNDTKVSTFETDSSDSEMIPVKTKPQRKSKQPLNNRKVSARKTVVKSPLNKSKKSSKPKVKTDNIIIKNDDDCSSSDLESISSCVVDIKTSSSAKKSAVKNQANKSNKTSKQKVKFNDSIDDVDSSSSDLEGVSPNVDITVNRSSANDETALQVLTRLEFDLNHSKNVNKDSKFKDNSTDDDDKSGSDSDWEEVEENKEQSLEDYNPEIPKDGVEITIDVPELNKKRKKKQFDHMEYIRLYINRERKEHQLNVHKTHLLCLLAHGFYINDLLNSNLIRALAISVIPSQITLLTSSKKIDKISVSGLEEIINWFCEVFDVTSNKQPFIDIKHHLSNYFVTKKALNASEYNLVFVSIARVLGFKTRLCLPFYPITYKAKNLLKKPGSKSNKKSKSSHESEDINEPTCSTSVESGSKSSFEKKTKKTSKLPGVKKDAVKKIKASNSNEKKKITDVEKVNKPFLRKSSGKSYKVSSDNSNDEDDPDYSSSEEVSDKKIRKPRTQKEIKQTPSRKQSNRQIVSSDSSPSSPENSELPLDKIVSWSEVFCKVEKRWVPIDCSRKIIDKPYDIEKEIIQPVAYIVAIDNNSYVKDVTRRYCSDYMTSTIKLRVDPDWWEETLEPFSPPNSNLDKEEEKVLEETHVNKPLPKTISEFKNHPLYALKRHLLKFEAIYPPDAAPVGFLRGEPIYARENVAQLHSRETWVKQARVVRPGEEAYKIVKARPKWDRIAGVMRTDLPLDIFGFWQTDPYKPPVAVDGKVPRNEYGNVELFKPCMLPIGTVHLQIPGLNRVAKKLGIDCSPAVVGFDGHKGSIHPVFDGFVVCKEFKKTLLYAWDEDQENARKREEEKREKRIYGNWRKLIRGLLIRERIKLKYDVK